MWQAIDSISYNYEESDAFYWGQLTAKFISMILMIIGGVDLIVGGMSLLSGGAAGGILCTLITVGVGTAGCGALGGAAIGVGVGAIVVGGVLVTTGIIQAVQTGMMMAKGAPGGGNRKPITFDENKAPGIMKHKKYGTFYKRIESDGSVKWWSKDLAGHGGSAWKVFTQERTGLKWFADADVYGDYIIGKHKGPKGLFINFTEFQIIK
jgi:hypothetical protein